MNPGNVSGRLRQLMNRIVPREASIGLGAHTHYWDGTAPDIATRLDELLVMAAGAARARG